MSPHDPLSQEPLNNEGSVTQFLVSGQACANGFAQHPPRFTFSIWAQHGWPRVSGSVVERLVTYRTERDKILLSIVSQPTPRVKVVHLELLYGPAVLAAPSVPPEHLLAQSLVRLWVKP